MDFLADLSAEARWYLSSFSALDRYFGREEQPVLHVTVEGDLITLARAIPELEFPGVRHADAATWHEGRRVYFRCIEPESKPRPQSFRPLNLLFDPERERYLDPYDDYRALRGEVLEPTDEPREPIDRLTDAAIAVSRYPHELHEALEPVSSFPELAPETIRSLLAQILTGPFAHKGLALLEEHGFVEAYLPELAGMHGTRHSKEHHPEGDVWTHSLETFRYRRSRDLTLTLGLLLHDSGKPLAVPNGNRRFDGHAEIGAKLARKLLRRLGFSEDVMEDVAWLVSKHMFPGALHLLPTFRTERLMADARFPILLELYRCDLESTYRGPDGYYRACKIYRDFMKHSANPYRSADGKKLVRLYVD
ncbi:MAG: HD domain-containing protein [Spirochaetota bacterium]